MTSIMTRIDRGLELSTLLLEMCKEYDMKKFWELQAKFDNLVMLNKLEDELNKEVNDGK